MPSAVNQNSPYSDPDLPLYPGLPVMVQVGGVARQFKTQFVGMIHRQCLVMALPASEGIAHQYHEGSPATVKFLHEGRIYGFRAQVLGKYLRTPCRFLFLEYPFEIETHELREKPRIHCLLLATVLAGPLHIEGVVVDVGMGGAKFLGRAPTGKKLESVKKDATVSLAISLMGAEDDQSITCQVKSLNLQDQEVEIGLAFMKADEGLASRIRHYVDRVLAFIEQNKI